MAGTAAAIQTLAAECALRVLPGEGAWAARWKADKLAAVAKEEFGHAVHCARVRQRRLLHPLTAVSCSRAERGCRRIGKAAAQATADASAAALLLPPRNALA